MEEKLMLATTKIGSATGGTTSGLASVMGSTWAKRIVYDAQPKRVLSKYFIEFNDLMSSNDVTLIIPKIGDVNLMGGRTGDMEGQSRSMTAFTGAGSITATLTASDVKLGGCAISFETAQATRVSIIEMAHKQLVAQYLKTIETDANSILEGASSPAGTVYGGDATSTATLAAGDTITVDKIVDMKMYLMEEDFGVNAGDAVLFIHPKQFGELLKSSQFVNAAEFGGNQVVRKGQIEEYVGCKIEVSTLVGTAVTASGDSYSAIAAQTTWGPGNGHYSYMIDPSAAAAIVWKEKAKVKVVTEDDERVYKILLDSWYQMKRINEKAIVIGCFADA